MLVPLVLGQTSNPVYGHDFYVSRDSGWCWFADPRAIVVGDKILAGGVTTAGDVVATMIDWRKNVESKYVLAKDFQRDDHDNPSFLRLGDGRIATFYSKHSGDQLYMRRTVRSDDPSDWTAPQTLCTFKWPDSVTYPNPYRTDRTKQIALFFRGINWKPTLTLSNDDGETWSKPKIVIAGKEKDSNNRPYFKAQSDKQSRVHLAFTDGHPRDEATNSIYYARLEKGSFRRADGSVIANLKNIPFSAASADVVYDGKADGVRAWIWDVSSDHAGNPIIVYTRLPKEDKHEYRYAWWNGRRWVDRFIVDGGKWFPKTPEGKQEPEPHYSGGLCLDPNDPRVVYLSRPINGRFEIERWFTPDGGEHWSHVAITGNSKHDSVRPFVLRQDLGSDAPHVLFENARKYVHYTNYESVIQATKEDRGPWPTQATKQDVARVTAAVWHWTRSNSYRHAATEWTMAPLYLGVLDYSEMAHDAEPKEWVRAVAQGAGWKLGPRQFMADDNAVGATYLRFFEADKKPEELTATQAWADSTVAHSFDEPLLMEGDRVDREWNWCDALFMAPPVLAKLSQVTGDRRYLDKMNQLWWKTTDYLLDPSEHLFYRDSRYFTMKETNGKKVFWSRGNGWVIAGLARILEVMPADYPTRLRYEKLFKDMSARIAELQQKDGAWRSSLLDPDSYPAPETSGTSFYCYALAWGVRNHFLDAAKYNPVVDRAWAALVRAVDMNGHVGLIQPIGADPKHIQPTDNDSYGVGGVLMAGAEIAKR